MSYCKIAYSDYGNLKKVKNDIPLAVICHNLREYAKVLQKIEF